MIPVLHCTYALFFCFVQNCFVAWFLTEIYLSKSVVKMHIKSIILEGFKSYAQRTEVNGFDPLFNAITGLNGSGKSNILDSICFLLGISNLSQVNFLTYVNLSLRNLKGIFTLGESQYYQYSLHLYFYVNYLLPHCSPLKVGITTPYFRWEGRNLEELLKVNLLKMFEARLKLTHSHSSLYPFHLPPPSL